MPIEAEVVEQLGAEQLIVFPIAVSRYVAPGTAGQPADGAAPHGGHGRRDAARRAGDDAGSPRDSTCGSTIRRDQRVDVYFDAERLYLFDPETGLALDDRGRARPT